MILTFLTESTIRSFFDLHALCSQAKSEMSLLDYSIRRCWNSNLSRTISKWPAPFGCWHGEQGNVLRSETKQQTQPNLHLPPKRKTFSDVRGGR